MRNLRLAMKLPVVRRDRRTQLELPMRWTSAQTSVFQLAGEPNTALVAYDLLTILQRELGKL